MPFSEWSFVVPHPKPEPYPNELKTIGDHLRAWRVDNQLRQSDVARILGVCEDTIIGWEMRAITPCMRQIPSIIKLIGYLPVEIDTSTFGGRINHYRYMLGMTPKQFGFLIPADASTVRDWENGRHIPPKRKRLKIATILRQIVLKK